MNALDLTLTWQIFYTKRDEKSKQKLVEHYFLYVQNIAQKLAQKLHFKVSADELSSFGVDGLYRAIEAFNIKKKIKFETYSYNRIKGSMIDAIRANDWVPRSVRLRAVKLDNAKSKLENKLGEMVSDDEIYKQWHVRRQAFKSTKKFRPTTISSIDGFSEKINDAGSNDHNDCLISKNLCTPDSKLIRKEFLKNVLNANCNNTEKKIVYLYYYKALTMREIAYRMGMSESRVSQIHHDVLSKLKKHIRNNMGYFNKDILHYILQCNDKGPL